MSQMHDNLKRDEETWYLRKANGAEFGPLPLATIVHWAAESRVAGGNLLSTDRKNWVRAEEVPELDMVWFADLADGRRYGPFNVLATCELHAHKVLPGDAIIRNPKTGEKSTVAEYLARLKKASDSADGPAQAPAADTNAPTSPARPPRRTAVRSPRDAAHSRQAELFAAAKESAEPDAATAADDPAATDPAPTGTPPAEDAELEDEPIESGAPAADDTPTPPPAPLQPAAPASGAAADLAAQVTEMLRQAEEAQAGRAGAEARCTALGRQLSEAERRSADEERRSRDRLAAAEEGHRRALQAEADLRGEAERKARDTDERLQASLVELKKSRHEETKAATALRDAEAHNARRAAALETRLRDVLQERNQLSELVEAEVKRRGRLKAFAALCLVAATVGVIFAVLALWRARTPADAGAEAPATPAAPAGRPAARPRPPSRPDAGGSLPMLRETGGARIEYQRDGCRVVFDRGAFSTQTAVAESARQVMRQLAPQIKPHLQTFILQIEGHTDNTPVGSGSRFGSNTELARARAQAFADFLRREHGFPAEKMRPVAAAGGPPHPNNDDAGRARNRTVVLKLVRHAGP